MALQIVRDHASGSAGRTSPGPGTGRVMKNLDERTLERIIEQITSNVLILLRQEQERAEAGGAAGEQDSPSAHNYVERVGPVVSAGADRVARTLGIAPTPGR